MQKTAQTLVFVFIASLLCSCNFVRQTGEMKRFVECNFSVYSVEVQEINGINVSGVKNASDLGWVNILAIGQKALSGSLPAKLKFSIIVHNTSDKDAGIAGLDYKFFLDEDLITEGSIREPINVAANSVTRFPVVVDVDLVKLLNSNSSDKLLDLAFGADPQKTLEELNSRIELKPYYLSGTELKKYPGHVNIKP
jgi:hypothetical protein